MRAFVSNRSDIFGALEALCDMNEGTGSSESAELQESTREADPFAEFAEFASSVDAEEYDVAKAVVSSSSSGGEPLFGAGVCYVWILCRTCLRSVCKRERKSDVRVSVSVRLVNGNRTAAQA